MARDSVTPSLFADLQQLLWSESTRRFMLLGWEVVCLLIIILSLEALGSRSNWRFDLSPGQKYSLSEVSIQTVQSLTQPVQATVFYRRGEREKYKELMQMFAEKGPEFSYRLFDLDRAPGLAQQYGVSSYGVSVIETAQNRVTLPVTDEERVLNGLLRAMQSQKTVYFLTGHGENDISDMEERVGYGIIRKVLETENYRVRPLPLREAQVVPPDADLLIASGPREEFTAAELAALSAYFTAGGNGLFLLDPYMVPGLAHYLSQFGFTLGDDVVVDNQMQIAGGDPLMPAVSTFVKEVFPRDPRGEPMLPVVRPVHVRDGNAHAFAFTGETSWSLKNRERAQQSDFNFRDGEDLRGPIPIAAVAATGPEKSGKLVVIGDSDFVDNFYARVPGNVDFFMNTIGWMLGRQELIALGRTPNVPEAKRQFTPQQSLYLSASQSRRFFWAMVVLEPLAVFALGFVVFVRRRSKG